MINLPFCKPPIVKYYNFVCFEQIKVLLIVYVGMHKDMLSVISLQNCIFSSTVRIY